MLAERLNVALERIGVSTADLARSMGCDRTNVSRVRHGSRTPLRDGRAARRLVGGICSSARERGATSALRSLVGCGEDASDEELSAALMGWLYDEGAARGGKAVGGASRSLVADRVDDVMRLADLSNARLGRMLHVDASSVSRFRSGARAVRADSPVADALCDALLRRLCERGRLPLLAALLDVPGVPPDEGELRALLLDWLCGPDEADCLVIERLLESVGSLAVPEVPEVPPAVGTAGVTATEGATYFGVVGLREAVARFLGEVARAGAPLLLLYSDQDMAWLVDDEGFRARWSSLMLACVRRGTRIRIVHNLGRGLVELTDAITSWLPLYLSGAVESRYCVRQQGLRFSNSLFLCPGLACVEGGNVAGQEGEHGVWRYHSDADTLRSYELAYEGLVARSRRLVRTSGPGPDGQALAVGGERDMVLAYPELPFANTRLVVSDVVASVSRLAEPRASFTVFHPALREAFSAYARQRLGVGEDLGKR